MRRRDFIAALGAGTAGVPVWASAAHSQQADVVRRVSVLSFGQNTLSREAIFAEFRAALERLNWFEGRNLRIDQRFVADSTQLSASAHELVDTAPEVIITTSLPVTRAAQQSTRLIPIIFITGGDPSNNGLIRNITRPEGNITGFASLFSSVPGKWLELLKEAAPDITRVAVVYNPEVAANSNVGPYYLSIREAAAALDVRVFSTPVRNAMEITTAFGAFASEPNGALIILPPPYPLPDRELIYRLAVAHRLPAIYHVKEYANEGGLLAYAPSLVDLWRSAATYLDRILRGAKPSDLPVQFPTKFTLIVNLRTARAMGLTIPNAFLLRADEIVE
jgi:putative ABC transport system substrate-binding protein